VTIERPAREVQAPTGVGWTSLITTYARAQESRRPDRLFDDPWAADFIAAATTTAKASKRLPRVGPARDDDSSALWEMFCAYFAGRTPFYDQQLLAGVDAGASQVVLLAAGLDMRASRLELPASTTVFEVDSEPVLRFKQHVLGHPEPGRIPVVADLRKDWVTPLRAAGFQPGIGTVWIAEGLLMYLDVAQCDRLLDTVVALSGPGSRFATEYFTRNPRHDDVEISDDGDLEAAEMVLSLFSTGPQAAPERWLTAHGLQPDRTDIATELQRLGRPVPAMFDPHRPDTVGLWLTAGTLGEPIPGASER
jgi:methyltransferase (TIGR00027 family)